MGRQLVACAVACALVGALAVVPAPVMFVTTSSGGQVTVICNESNATSFMSYGGQ
jgi:hypothetical protein